MADSKVNSLAIIGGFILARVNSTKDYSIINSINTAVDRFHRCVENKLTLVPLKGKICIEAYGDSAFDESNQIGYCLVLRQEKTQKVNFIGWRSIKSDRKAWSTLAAETHAMQYVMDGEYGMKALLHELGLGNTPTTVMTDNLSLKKVFYSGRSAEEVRLRRELGILRDLMLNDEVSVRFVETKKMIADDLTKSERNTGEKARGLCRSNRLEYHNDKEENGPGDMTQAEKDILLLDESDESG